MQHRRASETTGVEANDREHDRGHGAPPRPDRLADLHGHLVQAMSDGALIIDVTDSNIVEANPRLCELAGIERAQLIGRSPELLSPFLGLLANDLCAQIIRIAERGERKSLTLRRASGLEIPAVLTVSRFSIGRQRYLACLIHTEPDTSTQPFLSAESLLPDRIRFFDRLPLGCQIIDHKWRYRYVNQEAARHYRERASRLIGRTLADCHPGIEETPFYAALAQCMYDRIQLRTEEELEYRDGSKRMFELVVFPVSEGILVLSVDLAERLQSEAAVANLAAIVDASQQAIISSTTDGTITSWNRGAEWLYGYSAAEAIGNPVLTILPPDREGELASIFRLVRRGERIEPYDTIRRRKDGSLVDVLLTVSPVYDRRGHITAVSAIALDISARKQAERQARDSNERFAMIANTIQEVFWTADSHISQVYYVSPAYEAVWGRTREELYENSNLMIEAVHPSDRVHVRKDLRAHETGRPFSHEYRIVRPDDTVRWIANRGYPVFDNLGTLIRYVGIAQDITERRGAQEQIEEQARLLDVASDVIVVVNTRNRIKFWNRSAERVLGLAREEVIGADVLSVVRLREDPAKIQDYMKAVYSQGEWTGELRLRSVDDREITMLVRLTLIRDEEGGSKAILAVGTDVTDQRAIEHQLLRAQRMESLGALAGGIAHDLNNLLVPIIMGSEGLSLRNPDDATKRIIEIIRSSAERGTEIVRQILGFARGIEGERTEVHLKHVLREVQTIIEATFPNTIEAMIDIPADISPVLGDSTQIQQVIMNICVNARDAMPEGGHLTVRVQNARFDETYARMHVDARPIHYVVVELSDTGRGMESITIDRIFEPFFTTKPTGKGTGLGLSTAMSIVKSHGGFIDVQSEINRGTTFKVYFPAAETQAREEAGDAQEAIPMGNGELVVVVDAAGPVREVAREILEAYGYRAITTADGTEALVVYLQQHEGISVMIVDMMLPYLDGPATIRALRKINPKVRIIATGDPPPDEQGQAAQQVGADALVTKPYTAETLLRTLCKVILAEGAAGTSEAGP